MPKLTLDAGAEGVERKYAGNYIFVRAADGPLDIIINQDRYSCIKGSHIGPISPGFSAVIIDNKHTGDNAIDLQLSKANYGENLLILDKGDEGSPLYVTTPRASLVRYTVTKQAVGNGNRFALFVAPVADKGVWITGINITSEFKLELGYGAAADATVAGEAAGWASDTFNGVTLGSSSDPTCRTLANHGAGASATSDAAAGNVVGVYEAGNRIIEVKTPIYLPAGHAVGLVTTFKNVSGVVGDIAMQMWGELE